LNFRHLLEKHHLANQFLQEINAMLAERGLLLKQGTIIDATFIEAPTSTKNASGKRDPEIHQAKKDKNWHIGMKAHLQTRGWSTRFKPRHPTEVTSPKRTSWFMVKKKPFSVTQVTSALKSGKTLNTLRPLGTLP